jgi:predicted metal-dependent hydrolase
MGFSFLEYFIIILIIIIILFYIKKYYGEIEYVKSKIDNRYYLVRKLADKQKASDMLADINKDCISLIKHLMKTYPDNVDIKRLHKNYNPDSISEGSADSGYTSYSVNKGEKIILCLRQKENNEFVDKNIVMYVTIHELSHLMTHEIGHTKKFWDNFRFILKEAVEIGIYKKVDYSKSPVKYCGIKITSSII